MSESTTTITKAPTKVRRCAACGEVLVRRDAEKRSAFQRRKTCGRSCAAKSREVTPLIEGRQCMTCGVVLVRKDGEGIGTFKARKSCDRKCASIKRIRTVNPKTCVNCGEALLQRRGENGWNYARRISCGKDCGNQSRGMTIEKACKHCGKALTLTGTNKKTAVLQSRVSVRGPKHDARQTKSDAGMSALPQGLRRQALCRDPPCRRPDTTFLLEAMQGRGPSH